jgi:serine/threonine protein kinase/regulator of sirC expression with transglutaminase-like and TPR domain
VSRNPDAEITAAAPLGDVISTPPDFALRGGGASEAARLDSWCASYDGSGDPVNVLRDAHLTDPKSPSRLAAAGVALPEVGGEFCGFKLVTELGRGAFGKVFLSHQGDLADRPVALKVSTEIRDESQRLARLQHTNIVPIYSFHRLGPLQAVCMPYFGSATLADVANELSRRDSLPATGKAVASAVYDRRSRTMRRAESHASTVRPSPPLAPMADRPSPPPEAVSPRELKQLEGLSYVEAILWIGARLAEGLAHAHERGILHRDLKPANVLLTDDGQPMLLDFNLAEDTDRAPGAASAMIGGTLPYMAPEHLEAFGGTWRNVDARSDIYSLGVILYELLTGRTPFTRRTGPPEKVLPDLVAERRKGAPEVSRYNKEVSPAAEAIVRKCLEPDPDRRYQNAQALREDLDRHLADLPLCHQPEPSRRERAQKWLRRNQWVRSTGVVSTVAVVLLGCLGTLAWTYMTRADREETANRLTEFRKAHRGAQSLLYAHKTDRLVEEDGLAAARHALALYGLPDDAAWQTRPAVRQLSADDRALLAHDVGQVLVLLAGSVAPDAKATPEQKAEALRLNELAEASFGKGPAPRALWAQRAGLVADSDQATQLRELAARTELRESWDHYLAARALLRAGKLPEAIEETRRAVAADPNSFAAWFLLGNCCLAGGSNGAKIEAAVHYSTCASLLPDFFGPYFNRGLARLSIETPNQAEAAAHYTFAEDDFTDVLRLRPEMAEAHLQRALARSRLGSTLVNLGKSDEGAAKLKQAVRDADEALAGGVAPARVYLMRSQLREKMGDAEGAQRDLAEGLRQKPVDFQGWMDRGKARLRQNDPKGALGDFAAASACKRHSREAIHAQAYVLGELLKRPADAIRLMDRELELDPNQPVVIAGRGVYHAQLGHRKQAVDDATAAAKKAPREGEVLYRAACIFALTSRSAGDPTTDRHQAIGYLARALESGFGFEYVETDTDLAPLRGDAEFAELRKLIDKTRKLKGWL